MGQGVTMTNKRFSIFHESEHVILIERAPGISYPDMHPLYEGLAWLVQNSVNRVVSVTAIASDSIDSRVDRYTSALLVVVEKK
jgi:hypothetical protein